jgi:hypothetical protein
MQPLGAPGAGAGRTFVALGFGAGLLVHLNQGWLLGLGVLRHGALAAACQFTPPPAAAMRCARQQPTPPPPDSHTARANLPNAVAHGGCWLPALLAQPLRRSSSASPWNGSRQNPTGLHPWTQPKTRACHPNARATGQPARRESLSSPSAQKEPQTLVWLPGYTSSSYRDCT